jgi:hypothetical protein
MMRCFTWSITILQLYYVLYEISYCMYNWYMLVRYKFTGIAFLGGWWGSYFSCSLDSSSLPSGGAGFLSIWHLCVVFVLLQRS